MTLKDGPIRKGAGRKLSRVEKNGDRPSGGVERGNVTDRQSGAAREGDRQRQTEGEIDSDRGRDRRAV